MDKAISVSTSMSMLILLSIFLTPPVSALDAYEEATKIEPNNAQAKSGLKAVNDAIAREASQDQQADMGLSQIFQDPNFLQKLASNPKTSPYLGDPQFMEKLNRIRTNPSAIQTELSDPRVMQVIAALLGIQMEMPDSGPAGEDRDTDMPDVGSSTSPPLRATPPPPYESTEQDAQDEEDKAKIEEQKAKKVAKEAADKEKALGTENYKKRNFEAAIQHYSKAWELHEDITYLNNLAAARFEAGDYEGCIKECEKAIEEGREMRADFKLIAKYAPPPTSS